MERRKTMLIGVAAGTGIAVVAVLAMALAYQNFAETGAVDKSMCWSEDQFESAFMQASKNE